MKTTVHLALVALVIWLSPKSVFGADSYQSNLSIVGHSLDARGQLHLVLRNQVLRNQQPKTVSGFVLRHPGGSVQIQEFLPPKQRGLLPGVNYDLAIPLNASASDVERNVQNYAITAVVFSDSSSEGLASDVNQIVALRAGRAYGLRQLLPILEGLRRSQENRLADNIHATAAAIASRPLHLEDGTQATGLFANGLQNANSLTAGDLKNIEMSIRLSVPTRRGHC